MALSKICEIEIDSAFRTLNSASASDFEFQLPYSFPNYKSAQIQLGNAFIPNTWYNIFAPLDCVVQNTTTSVISIVTVPPGSYTAASLAQALNAGIVVLAGSPPLYANNSAPLAAYSLSNVISFVWSGITKKIILGNNSGNTYTFSGTPLLSLLGFSSSQIASLATVGLPSGHIMESAISPNVNSDRDRRFYVRISGFESKIMLPQLPQQIFTFALNLKETGAGLGYVTIPQDDQEQTLILSDNQIRSNTTLRIQLVDSEGKIIDLNGRNWKFILRVEPNDKMFLE